MHSIKHKASHQQVVSSSVGRRPHVTWALLSGLTLDFLLEQFSAEPHQGRAPTPDPHGQLRTHGDGRAQKDHTHSKGSQRHPSIPGSDLILREPKPAACLTSGLCCLPGRWPASSLRCCRPHCCCRRHLGVRPSPRKEDKELPGQGPPSGGMKCYDKCFDCRRAHGSTRLVRTEPGTTPSAPLGPFPLLKTTELCQPCPFSPCLPFPIPAPQKNSLYLHVQKLHQCIERAHFQEQKDVVAHPGLHFCLRAALSKRACKHRHSSRGPSQDRTGRHH